MTLGSEPSDFLLVSLPHRIAFEGMNDSQLQRDFILQTLAEQNAEQQFRSN